VLGPRRPGQTRVATVRANSGVPLDLAVAVDVNPPDIACLLADIPGFTFCSAGSGVVERVAIEAALVQELDGNEALAGHRTLTFTLGHALERLQDVRPYRAFCSILGVSQDSSEILLGTDRTGDKGLATVIVGILAPVDGADVDLIRLPTLGDEFVSQSLSGLIGREIGGGAGDSDVAVLHRLESRLEGGDVGLDSLHVALEGADAPFEFGKTLVLFDVLVRDRLDGGLERTHLAGEFRVGGVDLLLNRDLHLFREVDRLGSRSREGQ